MLTDLALGRGALDRLAERRGDEAWFDTLCGDAATVIVGVSAGDVALDAEGALADVREQRHLASHLLLIGAAGGRSYVAACFDAPLAGFRSLREAGAGLCDDEAAVATAAVALHQWHRAHTRCPRCGEPTRIVMSGWERRCPADGSSHFPRTDPAVIVVITDDDDRLLLARQVTWPARRFSLVAGYVEPGETAEHAVAREVLEEVGLRVDSLEYLGSQPWPFPASLMLAYRAHATHTDFRVDGEEISEAAWWSRDALRAAVADGTLLLPGAVSVARRAIEDWYGSALAD